MSVLKEQTAVLRTVTILLAVTLVLATSATGSTPMDTTVMVCNVHHSD